jgi:signal transduction histidine kinase
VGAGECAGRLPPLRKSAGLLDGPGYADGQFQKSTTRRSITLKAEQTEPQPDEVERLRGQVDDLRASRARIVLAADADRRSIEAELHENVQQHLVALAVKLQLAGPLVDTDPPAARTILEEMQRDVQEALDEAARLSQRIYPQLLEAGGLAAALRSAAVSAGVPASVKVTAGSAHAPEMLTTLYFCWLEVLEHSAGNERATATVKEEQGTLTFEFAGAGDGTAGLEGLRDRVEALGGRLTFDPDAEDATYVSGSLPVSG